MFVPPQGEESPTIPAKGEAQLLPLVLDRLQLVTIWGGRTGEGECQVLLPLLPAVPMGVVAVAVAVLVLVAPGAGLALGLLMLVGEAR